MPLPQSNVSWPPEELAPIRKKMAEWDAWYRGDPEALGRVYGPGSSRPATRPSQWRGGLVGAAARFMWGRPVPDGQQDGRLHIPLAADLAQASADLLYAEAPAVTMTETGPGMAATNERLEEYVDDGMVGALAAGAEVGAALGGRYQRVTVDPAVSPDRPFLSTVDADAAWPTFRHGRLVAVTFWWVLETNGGQVLRHLERHELVDGIGMVYHGLYRGTGSHLGRVIPLTDHPSTAHLATAVDQDGAVKAGRTPGLMVEYVPNITPNRSWRSLPAGRALGRSDFDSVEPLFDALDEAYTSWMRDVRVAKARLLVPEYMTRTSGPGQGIIFDLDRDVYTTVNTAPGEDGDAPITPMQFSIRVTEHQATTQDLIENILRSSGYSAATFGEDEVGAATATETNARKGRTLSTRNRKVRLERPALARMVEKMLTVDAAVFGTKGLRPGPVAVDFGAGAQESPLQLAQTVAAVETARAASVETKIAMLHPDWGEDEVAEEAARVRGDYSMGPLADPDANVFGFGRP